MRARVAEDGGAVGGVGGDAGELGLDRVGNRGEAVELLVEEVGVRFVGGGEVGPDPGQLELRVLGAGTGEGQHLGGIGVAEPTHAAVVLDVDPGRAALGPGASGDQVAEAVAPDGDLRAGGERDRRARPRLSAPIVSSGTWGKRRPTWAASARGRHRQPASRPRPAPPSAQPSAPWP